MNLAAQRPMHPPISDYALIGDCETAALVARNGSVDWLCWPRFDSEACFAALLGGPEHGLWRMAPMAEPRRIERRYRGDTLVLETLFQTEEGEVAVIDFMPVRDDEMQPSQLIRLVEGRRGRCRMCTELAIRFDYGRIVPWVTSGIQFFEARSTTKLLPVSAYLELLARYGFVDIGTVGLTPTKALAFRAQGRREPGGGDLRRYGRLPEPGGPVSPPALRTRRRVCRGRRSALWAHLWLVDQGQTPPTASFVAPLSRCGAAASASTAFADRCRSGPRLGGRPVRRRRIVGWLSLLCHSW
jgi:hypothetical protein